MSPQVNGDNGVETTYSQILQGTVDVAVGLQRLGVKRGYTVALCGESTIEYLTTALGAICCGATITPMNPMYPKGKLHDIAIVVWSRFYHFLLSWHLKQWLKNATQLATIVSKSSFFRFFLFIMQTDGIFRWFQMKWSTRSVYPSHA